MGIIEKMRLDGKKIFVTGGARGIGKSVATAFAEAGADIAIVDVDLKEAEKTARELQENHPVQAIAVQARCALQAAGYVRLKYSGHPRRLPPSASNISVLRLPKEVVEKHCFSHRKPKKQALSSYSLPLLRSPTSFHLH